MPACPGCGIIYVGRSYTNHLGNSKQGACADARRAAEAKVSDSESDEEIGENFATEFPTGGGAFQGDFFGDNYTAADFGHASDSDSDSDSDLEDDSEDEDDDPQTRDAQAAADARVSDGWEPPRPASNNSGEDTAMPAPDTETPPPARLPRKIAEDRFHQEPIVDKYPGLGAGAPISAELAASAEKTYSDILGESPNPYAPFTSKIDWEVARWAKLRGSGSTAFTDLLQIAGVGGHFDICDIY
jgi:hypothetical protein